MKEHLEFSVLPLSGLQLVNRKILGDERGFLSRFFCGRELEKIGFYEPIAQINHTLTEKTGSIRGMHYQCPPHSEVKIVSCLKGEIFDVAVDLRKDSPTFLKWHAEILSAKNKRSLFIPKGFAHGFQTLTDDCELLYLHSEFYEPDYESALNAFDSRISIEWPLKVTEMSERDRTHKMIDDNFTGILV